VNSGILSRPDETFDEIFDRYATDPIAFLEAILRRPNRHGHEPRYEFAVGDDCSASATWDRITHRRQRHVTRKKHARDGRLPFPHRFQPRVGFFRLQSLSESQLRELIARYRIRPKRAERAELLEQYLLAKFSPSWRADHQQFIEKFAAVEMRP
jgi:hypothetical protein